MLQAFIIFFREGFEAFLIVAIILTYLGKTGRNWLKPAVYSAIAASVIASVALGYVLMQGVNHSLWEGILGLVAVVMVASLVIHMWRTAPQLKSNLEKTLREVSSRSSRWRAIAGIFFFTLLMITREGMETALMLLQVRDGRFLSGLFLGLAAAGALALAWIRYGYLINLKQFFQVTGIFLLLFMVQVAIYSFHELSEAGVLPASEAIHEATEPFSPYGVYGKWFSLMIVVVCAGWLAGSWVADRSRRRGAARPLGAVVIATLLAGFRVPAEAAPESAPEARAGGLDSLAAELKLSQGSAPGNEEMLAQEVPLGEPAEAERIAELERRLDLLAGELERLRLDEEPPVAAKVPAGLGRAAAKVYTVDRGVSIGGYGEMLYQDFDAERQDGSASGRVDELDFLRAIVYVGAKFNDQFLFNSEIEFEHASTDEAGSVSVEFAYIEGLWRPEANFRAGLLLLPVGFINELHEPTAFLGARRPGVEQAIIPTTWRENGVGIYGEAGPFNYRGYLVNGLDGAGFSASGLRNGRQHGSHAKAEDLAGVLRVDYTGALGLLAGASIYGGDSGQDLALSDGSDVNVGTILAEGHLEWKYQGVEFRALGAQADLDNVAELNAAHPDSLTGDLSVGERLSGYYLELGYDVMTRWPHGEQSLTPYVRREQMNTQDEVPAGFSANPANDSESLTYGVAYAPIDPLIVKVDYQNLDNAAGSGVDQFNVAVGYIF
jgi:FTR1 family protein